MEVLKQTLETKNNILMQLGLYCCIFSIIMVVYNQTMQVESMGYTLFALLAIPYIIDISDRRKEQHEKSSYNYT